MDYGRAFSYVFADPAWLKKVGIAALLSLTIIGFIPVMGWALEVTRRVSSGEPDVLPEWSNFSDFLMKGIQAFVISFAYSLPLIIIDACTNILPVITSKLNGDSATTISSIISVVSICLSCVIFLYSVVIGLIMPAALGNFAATGQIGSGFRFGEIFGLFRAATGPYIIVYLLSIVTSLIACVGVIACVIGIWVTAAYAVTINAHLWGQAYKVAKSALPPAATNMQPAGM